jgi:hypothetical protein
MQKLLLKRIGEVLDFIQCPLPLEKTKYFELLPAIVYWLEANYYDDDLAGITMEEVGACYESFISTEASRTMNISSENILIGFHLKACVYETYPLYAEDIHYKVIEYIDRHPANEHGRPYAVAHYGALFVEKAEGYFKATGRRFDINEEFFLLLKAFYQSDEADNALELFESMMNDTWGEKGSYSRICGKVFRRHFTVKTLSPGLAVMKMFQGGASNTENSAEDTIGNYITPTWTFNSSSDVKRYFYDKAKALVRQQRVVSVFDYEVAQLHEVKKLIENYIKERNPLSGLLILSLATGIDAEDWIKMMKARSKSIKLSEEKDFYWYRLHKVGYDTKSFEGMARYSQETRSKVKVTLPAFLQGIVKDIDLPENISIKLIREHLNVFNASNNLHLTPARIRKSFRAFASDVCNVDEITIAYIANMFAETSITQSFYTQVTANHLSDKLADILSDLFNKLGLIELAMLPEQTNHIKENYGSRAAPEIKTMVYLFKNIREMYYSADSLKIRMNWLSFYSYLGLQLTTSLRRLTKNSKSLIADDFSEVILRDKDNNRHYEFRVISLCDVIAEQLRIMQRYRQTLRLPGHDTSVDSYFKLTDLLYHIPPRTENKYYDKGIVEAHYFNKIGIGNNCITMNFCRHFLRTTLKERKFSYEITNYWLGHMTEGLEMTNKYSFAGMPDVQREIVGMQDLLINECCYEVLK